MQGEEKHLVKKIQSLCVENESNILILGETGVGKSTFINAFSNYFSYPTLKEAKESKIAYLIPSSFTVTDQNFEIKTVVLGSDPNECEAIGSAKTQYPRCYNFKQGKSKILRLIDTPGIGDTRGLERDLFNFDNILKFISQFKGLNGIIILLKPNNSRLSIVFRFCIQELLCHLHKDASKNIVFVFTHARSTFYKPGDTLPILKAMLEDIESKEPFVKIPLNKDTIYCLDSEAFRFLVAVRNDVEFTEDEELSFSGSWTTSVNECQRLFRYITRLQPHNIQDTICLNNARKQIVFLSKPLGDITQNIQTNLIMIEEQKIKIKNAGDNIQKLEEVLYVPVMDLVPINFDEPRTVCTSPSCVDLYTIKGVTKVDYTQLCHNPCRLQNIAPDLVNNVDLMNCQAMCPTGKCRHCGCGWAKHMHIYYEYKQIEKKILNKNVQKDLKCNKESKALIEKGLKDLEKRFTQLNYEQTIITKVSAQFAYFLKKNAITPYNDAQLEYMEYLIHVEEQNLASNPNKKPVLELLRQMRDSYKEQVKILDQNLNSAVASAANIDACINELYSLSITGSKLKAMSIGMEGARQKELMSFNRKILSINSKKDVPTTDTVQICTII